MEQEKAEIEKKRGRCNDPTIKKKFDSKTRRLVGNKTDTHQVVAILELTVDGRYSSWSEPIC